MSQLIKDKAYLETVASSLLGDEYVLVNKDDINTIYDYVAKNNQIKANDTTLKSYFETGDIPSETEFAELIDSKLSRGESYLKGEVYTKEEIDKLLDVMVSEKVSILGKELELRIREKIVEEINKKTVQIEEDFTVMGKDIFEQVMENTSGLVDKFEKDFSNRITVIIKRIIEEEYGIVIL